MQNFSDQFFDDWSKISLLLLYLYVGGNYYYNYYYYQNILIWVFLFPFSFPPPLPRYPPLSNPPCLSVCVCPIIWPLLFFRLFHKKEEWWIPNGWIELQMKKFLEESEKEEPCGRVWRREEVRWWGTHTHRDTGDGLGVDILEGAVGKKRGRPRLKYFD